MLVNRNAHKKKTDAKEPLSSAKAYQPNIQQV
jgi:hypothetical protein